MTICIGVLAADEEAIICIADRFMAYNTDIAGETDSVKIFPVGDNGARALISGTDDAVGRVLAKLIQHDDLGKNRAASMKYCEDAYREAEREMLAMRFVGPFIKIEAYEAALLKRKVNEVIKAISEEIDQARKDPNQPFFNCGFLLCGFDEHRKPYILNLGAPGGCVDVTQTGFSAMGSGSSYALQNLLGSGWERKYPIDRAIYEVFDAKSDAEQDPNVGWDWDAVVLTADKSVSIPEDTKTMLDQVLVKQNRSPYVEFDPEKHMPLPPEDWKAKLKTFAETIIPPEPQKRDDDSK
jgi:hypothetical protein